MTEHQDERGDGWRWVEGGEINANNILLEKKQ